jgi:hypothetical protein
MSELDDKTIIRRLPEGYPPFRRQNGQKDGRGQIAGAAPASAASVGTDGPDCDVRSQKVSADYARNYASLTKTNV